VFDAHTNVHKDLRERNRSHTQTHNKNNTTHDTTRTTTTTTNDHTKKPPPALNNDRRWRGDGAYHLPHRWVAAPKSAWDPTEETSKT